MWASQSEGTFFSSCRKRVHLAKLRTLRRGMIPPENHTALYLLCACGSASILFAVNRSASSLVVSHRFSNLRSPSSVCLSQFCPDVAGMVDWVLKTSSLCLPVSLCFFVCLSVSVSVSESLCIYLHLLSMVINVKRVVAKV